MTFKNFLCEIGVDLTLYEEYCEKKIIPKSFRKALLKGRTSFIIAHRLSTIKNSDKIYYVSDGNILEYGSHDELIESKGKYYHLYTSQLTND